MVLHGVSGDGISALYYCDYMNNIIKNGKIFCFYDSANIFETITIKKLPRLKWSQQNIYKLVNQ